MTELQAFKTEIDRYIIDTVESYPTERAMALLDLAEDLQAERDERADVVEKYATAARVIALHLKAFCNEKLSYDEMIADAARKASARIAAQAETLRVVEIDMERIKSLNKTSGVLNPSMTMCASEEIASAALAEIRREGIPPFNQTPHEPTQQP